LSVGCSSMGLPVKSCRALWTYADLSPPTDRCRQAVGRGPLIRLPDAAIGMRRLRVVAQVVRDALRGRCCARVSAWSSFLWVVSFSDDSVQRRPKMVVRLLV